MSKQAPERSTPEGDGGGGRAGRSVQMPGEEGSLTRGHRGRREHRSGEGQRGARARGDNTKLFPRSQQNAVKAVQVWGFDAQNWGHTFPVDAR